MDSLWSIHAMESYSALNRGGDSDTGYRMEAPEDIALSEISQAQKDKDCVIPLRGGA